MRSLGRWNAKLDRKGGKEAGGILCAGRPGLREASIARIPESKLRVHKESPRSRSFAQMKNHSMLIWNIWFYTSPSLRGCKFPRQRSLPSTVWKPEAATLGSLDSFSLIHESLIAEDLSLPQLRFRSPSSDISNLSQAYHHIKEMSSSKVLPGQLIHMLIIKAVRMSLFCDTTPSSSQSLWRPHPTFWFPCKYCPSFSRYSHPFFSSIVPPARSTISTFIPSGRYLDLSHGSIFR